MKETKALMRFLVNSLREATENRGREVRVC
jgi:hypothetical protein